MSICINKIKTVIALFMVIMMACESKPGKVTFTDNKVHQSELSEKELYDKVLGSLVGSAICLLYTSRCV